MCNYLHAGYGGVGIKWYDLEMGKRKPWAECSEGAAADVMRRGRGRRRKRRNMEKNIINMILLI